MAIPAMVTLESFFGVTAPGALSPVPRYDGNMAETSIHQPVLVREAVEHLAVRSGGVYVDATVGEGGHALSILQASAPQGRVLGIDLDPRSLARATQRLGAYGDRFIPARGNYAHLGDLARANGLTQVDGVLLDLGISSLHLEAEGYGFSFQKDEPLDMRYDPEAPRTAAHIVNTYPQEELARLLFRYGEEPRARSIARAIVQARPLNSTKKLADLVIAALGRRPGRRIHPATRTFQALRIAVNQELDNLAAGLPAAIQSLAPGGRLVVISYHSLEDRPVKTTLARESAGCICPPGLPVCVCQHQPTVRVLTRRVIRPTLDQVRSNPRSRSARMRVAQRL
jgi:16S rRNA (cytosine1402-N4)-methyltransferase